MADFDDAIDEPPEAYLARVGEVFARFDATTQDSGNVSYGVRVGARRYFVKTAGRVDDPVPPLDHAARVGLLRNAVALAESCPHRACPRLHRAIESPAGPLLVYDWCDGELLGRRTPAHARFVALPAPAVVACLDTIFDLHVHLAAAGWIANDFYDGCLIYDASTAALHVVDLDMYRRGPFRNDMGRMFGSTRFMAPEEHTLGASIDERTTVFNLGRAAFVFLGERGAWRGSARQLAVAERACAPQPADRFATVADFARAWVASS